MMLTLINFGLSIILLSAGAGSAPDHPPLRREPNTTLRLPPAPPVYGYRLVNAFPALNFSNPVAIVAPPGETNRLFVVEKTGGVIVITNLAQPTRTVFLNLSIRIVSGDERGLLGMAFHPGYATNRYFYLFYTLNTTTAAGSDLHDRLARFETSPLNPNQALANSELPLITQRDDAGNHNGGDLHFGPDGYLYVALGDEGGANDSGLNSQRIDRDFFAGILRIDVDRRPGGLLPNAHPAVTSNYAVPPDNPFVGATTFNGTAVNPTRVRTEFWAVGLRNPWRMAFDPVTGWLYCGDVGQDQREEIDIIVKGGNYGWNYKEGSINGPRSAPGGLAFLPPIYEYAHGRGPTQGDSVTGGVVYRGRRLSQLYGHYLFTDYVSGNLWSFRYDGTVVSDFQRLLADANIAAFGVDPRNGDVLLADHVGNQIKRLEYSSTFSGIPFPQTLADTGAFTNLTTLAPHPGIILYDLNVPFWSDGAKKTRWFSLPDTNLNLGFQPAGNWFFPTGSLWVKHFTLELTNGVPESARRLETRFLVRHTQGVYGITYRWGDSVANATLVPEEGLDEPFLIYDRGMIRTQIWHYPGRQECLECHTQMGGLALGFNTVQLNREFSYSGGSENQLTALSRAGYLNQPVSSVIALPALARLDDNTASLEYRVRSYLAANCVQCHQPGASGVGSFDARFSTPTALAGLIHGPLNNSLGDPQNRVVLPGSLERSLLFRRISALGPGRMPPLASNELNSEAVALLTEWITQGLPHYENFAAWQQRIFNSTNTAEALPLADPDGDGAVNYLEFLTGTHPLNPADAWKIAITSDGNQIKLTFQRLANRGFDVQFATELFGILSWESLAVPENRFRFEAAGGAAVILDDIGAAGSKYYRVRIFEP